MADDRMKNDDLQRDMGTGGRDDQDFDQGQQSPGRNPQQGGQQSGQHGGQQGGQRNKPIDEDDANQFGGGTGQRGQSRGGQNR